MPYDPRSQMSHPNYDETKRRVKKAKKQLESFVLPQSPAELAAMAALGPVGGKLFKGAMLGAGALASDDTEAGFFSSALNPKKLKKFNFPDSELHHVPTPVLGIGDIPTSYTRLGDIKEYQTSPLMQHVPGFADTYVRKTYMDPTIFGTHQGDKVDISLTADPWVALRHELQHRIDELQGRSQGSSEDYVRAKRLTGPYVNQVGDAIAERYRQMQHAIRERDRLVPKYKGEFSTNQKRQDELMEIINSKLRPEFMKKSSREELQKLQDRERMLSEYIAQLKLDVKNENPTAWFDAQSKALQKVTPYTVYKRNLGETRARFDSGEDIGGYFRDTWEETPTGGLNLYKYFDQPTQYLD